MKKNRISKWLMTALLALPLGGNVAVAQTQTETVSPCPQVVIDETVDHRISPICRQNGWDTVAGCGNTITLRAMPYMPVQRFNGTYTVEQIPYNPPDTTFYMNYNPAVDATNPKKKKLAISNDDDWAPAYVDIAFPFYFFGYRKNKFLLGDNGIVTFATPTGYTGGTGCPFATTTPLPWTSAVPTSGGTSGFDQYLMRDAIYGVFEDTFTGVNGAYMQGNQGIYYGVLDTFPCQKIIASWNQIPLYNDPSKRQSYQIVCYEGSNIIEVHVKKHNCCSSTNGGNALIGIQNATGLPQVASTAPDAALGFVLDSIPGKPAAFWPDGYNSIHGDFDTIAFRFTPQGTTAANCVWYRLFDDGNKVQLRDEATDPNATNDVDDPVRRGYCTTIEQPGNISYPKRFEAQVKPDSTSRYICQLLFFNANGDLYDLSDTITIGVPEKDVFVYTNTQEGDTVKELKVCQSNAEANIRLKKPDNQTLAQPITWQVTRVLNGEERTLPNSMYNVNNIMGSLHLNTDPEYDTLPENRIDSIWVRGFVEYTNHCLSSDSVLIRVYPIFDTFDVARICAGERYYWPHTQQYYTQTTTEPVFDTLSEPGCDSTVHLHLTVYDVSHTYDTIDTCAPLLWQDSILHDHTNTSTISIDTVIKKNIAECDSIVHLVLTIYPVEAHIRSSLQYFDFDNLDVKLDDISTGNASRTWHFPSGPDQTGAEAFWTMPTELDSADIRLIAHSQYGCNDTAHIVIPMNKENVWIPNAFMPDDPQRNNIFSTVSKGTVKQEMYIYNRRGQLVFHCEGTDCGWDGRDGNGDLCPQGAYVYLIRYVNKFNPEKTQVRKGTVTLIR